MNNVFGIVAVNDQLMQPSDVSCKQGAKWAKNTREIKAHNLKTFVGTIGVGFEVGLEVG